MLFDADLQELLLKAKNKNSKVKYQYLPECIHILGFSSLHREGC